MKQINLQLIQKVFLMSCLSLLIRPEVSGQRPVVDNDLLSADPIVLNVPVEKADATRIETMTSAAYMREKKEIPAWIIYGPKYMNDDHYLNGEASARGHNNAEQAEKGNKLGEKWTSYFSLFDTDEREITVGGWVAHGWSTIPAPSNAVVTNVHYRILVDDADDVEDFYPYDYTIEVYSMSTTATLWDQEGSMFAHNDNGYDDDEENDSDIYLEGNFDDFDGEDAYQTYSFLIWDNIPEDGHGRFCYIELMISWQAPDPNLRTDYTPPAWSAPIVVNHTSGSHSNATTLYANTTTYLNYSFAVEDTDIPEGYGVDCWIKIDDELAGAYGTTEGIEAGDYYSHENIEEVFTEGSHEVCQVVDLFDSYPESDEDDNEYCVTYTWIGPPDVPDLASPEDETTGQSISLTLSWHSSTNATGYTLQVDDNSDFTSTIVDESLSETVMEVSGLSEDETYYWRVRSSNPAGPSDWSDTWEFTTASEDEPNAITDAENTGYYLGQNHPNPFMETTTIEFRLPASGQVNIEFLDMQGRLIKSYTGYYNAGIHSLEINLQGKVKSGIYLYRMKTSGYIDSRMCIVR